MANVFARIIGSVVLGGFSMALWAQGSGPNGYDADAVSPREAANTDFTGYWVSFVTEDWRFRMVTAPKGDKTSVPLNDEGIRVADAWDWRADREAGLACKAYGAPALLRQPTRLRISWQDDHTLKVETDAGTQTRILSFDKAMQAKKAAAEAHSLQGVSTAEWESTFIPASGLGIYLQPTPPPSYTLKVETTNLQAGYLRTNGIPYSDQAHLTEYFDTFTHSNGQEWLVVTTVVDDPVYLLQPFITTTHFKRIKDDSGWRPTPCEIVPPPREVRPLPVSGYLRDSDPRDPRRQR